MFMGKMVVFLNETYVLDKMFTRKIKSQDQKIRENLERRAKEYTQADRIGGLIIDQDVKDYLDGYFGSNQKKSDAYWNHYNFLKREFI